MKKIILISVAAVIILTGILFLFLRSKSPATGTGNGAPTSNPFGTGDNVNIPSSGNTVGITTSLDSSTTPEVRLFRISNEPVSGFVAFARGTSTVVRYVDRATGNIYDALMPKVDVRSSMEKQRITNATLAKAYEADFSSDGSKVLLRFLKSGTDQPLNVSLALTPPKPVSGSSTPLYSVSATSLQGDIGDVAVSGDALYFVLKSSAAIVSSAFSGTGIKSLFSSPITDWHLAAAGSSVLAYPKASSFVSGSAYIIKSGSLINVAGPKSGLTAISSPDGSRVLYSYSGNQGPQMAMKNIQKGFELQVVPATLAEKCAWSLKSADIFYCGVPSGGIDNGEPDGWYRGSASFSDKLWAFNMSAQIAQIEVDPNAEFGVDIDIFNPQASPNGDYLIFMNKSDLTLWAAKI